MVGFRLKGELKICLAVITINTSMHIFQETIRVL